MNLKTEKYIVGKNWTLPTHESSLILLGLDLNSALNKLGLVYPNLEWSISSNTVVVDNKRREVWFIHAWDAPLVDPQREITKGCPNAKLAFWLFVNQAKVVVEVWAVKSD